jgi:aryl-alcohol dehydrogenase-like predicted oxidoreductase
MEQRRLGNTEVMVSAIALGCWPMGGTYWGGTDDAESVRTIHKALELGVSFFDSAPAYGAGHSELVLGQGLAGRRHEAVISTKASSGRMSAEELRAQLVESMQRMQTDYIDIYFIHWPNRQEPLARAMEALEGLRREGLIRAIGVSNFNVEMLEMASRYGTVDALQPPYNLIWRFAEEDVLPYCCDHGIGITTYSSLAQGMLTGTLRLTTTYRDGDSRPRSVLWQSENYGKCLYTVERLRPIAAELGVSVAQLALRWLVAQPGVSTALVGARTMGEIDENAGALGWDIPEGTLARVQEISDELYHSMPYYYDMWGNWSSWQRRGPQREI